MTYLYRDRERDLDREYERDLELDLLLDLEDDLDRLERLPLDPERDLRL